jgi:hypothetical protein
VERHQQLLEHIHFCTVDVANLLLGHLEAMRQELRALVASRGAVTSPRGAAPEAPINLDKAEGDAFLPLPYAKRGRRSDYLGE